MGTAVALDLERDFQEILQKSSIIHNSCIEKHLEFLPKKKEKPFLSTILLKKRLLFNQALWDKAKETSATQKMLTKRLSWTRKLPFLLTDNYITWDYFSPPPFYFQIQVDYNHVLLKCISAPLSRALDTSRIQNRLTLDQTSSSLWLCAN